MALTKWSDYQANFPEKAQQLTQILMCVKGVGVDDNYVLEADPVSGSLPIVVTAQPLLFTLDGADQEVTEDTLIPANNRPLPVKFLSPQETKITGFSGRVQANAPVRNDYVGSPVSTAAYSLLVAATTTDATRFQIFDSSGQTLVIAFGAAGAELDQFFVTPGGIDIDYACPAGTRISIKAVSANATVGEIDLQVLT